MAGRPKSPQPPQTAAALLAKKPQARGLIETARETKYEQRLAMREWLQGHGVPKARAMKMVVRLVDEGFECLADLLVARLNEGDFQTLGVEKLALRKQLSRALTNAADRRAEAAAHHHRRAKAGARTQRRPPHGPRDSRGGPVRGSQSARSSGYGQRPASAAATAGRGGGARVDVARTGLTSAVADMLAEHLAGTGLEVNWTGQAPEPAAAGGGGGSYGGSEVEPVAAAGLGSPRPPLHVSDSHPLWVKPSPSPPRGGESSREGAVGSGGNATGAAGVAPTARPRPPWGYGGPRGRPGGRMVVESRQAAAAAARQEAALVRLTAERLADTKHAEVRRMGRCGCARATRCLLALLLLLLLLHLRHNCICICIFICICCCCCCICCCCSKSFFYGSSPHVGCALQLKRIRALEAAEKVQVWSDAPFRDTNSCCRPLIGVPFLRLGQYSGPRSRSSHLTSGG